MKSYLALAVVSTLVCLPLHAVEVTEKKVACLKSEDEMIELLHAQWSNDTSGKSTMVASFGDLRESWDKYRALQSSPLPKECLSPKDTDPCSLIKRFKKSEVFESEMAPDGRTSMMPWAGNIQARIHLLARALKQIKLSKSSEQRSVDLKAWQIEFAPYLRDDFYQKLERVYISDKSDGLDIVKLVRDELRPPRDPKYPNEPVEDGICFAIHQSQEALQKEVKRLDETFINPKTSVDVEFYGKNLKPIEMQTIQNLKAIVAAAIEPAGRLQKACEKIRDEVLACLVDPVSSSLGFHRSSQLLRELEAFELPTSDKKSGVPVTPSKGSEAGSK
jgi:hypothetical protein